MRLAFERRVPPTAPARVMGASGVAGVAGATDAPGRTDAADPATSPRTMTETVTETVTEGQHGPPGASAVGAVQAVQKDPPELVEIVTPRTNAAAIMPAENLLAAVSLHEP